jgi:hypothetical protein
MPARRWVISAAMLLGLYAVSGCASCDRPASKVEPDSQDSPGQFYEDQCPDCATPGDDTFDNEVD